MVADYEPKPANDLMGNPEQEEAFQDFWTSVETLRLRRAVSLASEPDTDT